MIKIVIPGKPLPWKAPYVGRRGAFSPRAKILEAYRWIVKKEYIGPLIDNAVDCDILIYMPVPLGVSKATRFLMLEGQIRPTKRPDRTNIAKLVEDALNGIVIKDDSLIVGGRIEKWYCENPRVELIITRVSLDPAANRPISMERTDDLRFSR